ncbi:MAG: hypothetical protein IJT66_01370, partial [Clostridia bacterium]|nr:hypothetical protein [Clostridia bacterium]
PLHKPNPVFSIWSPKNPNAGQNFITETEKFEKPFTDLSDKLLKQGVDYHYGDEMVMAEHASVSGEGLCIGNCCYRTVVIPPVCVLQETTLQFLRELAERFGKEAVVFIRSFPDGMEQEDKERYTLVASVDEAVRFLRGRMRSEITLRDRNTNRPADQVYWRYTQTQDGKKTWFFVNAAENREYQTEMVLPFSFTPVVYDTVEDRRYRAPGTLTENGFILKADFTVGGSLMILEEPATAEPSLPFLQSGVTFPYQKRQVVHVESVPVGMLQSGNILPLDVVDYRAEGKEYRQTPIEFLWHSRFYRLKDGTPFEAAYAFTVDRLPEKPLLAFVEMGRHLDAVTLNGKPLSSVAAESRPEYLKDSFDAFLLDTLQVGRNEIVIQGKKCSNINGVGSHTRVPAGTEHIPTELEPVLLYGDFNAVETEEGHYVVDTGDRSVKGSTVFCGKPFYSGRIVYPVPVAQGGRLIRVEADAQSVTLLHNGKTVGTSYLKPFVFSLPLDLAERDRLEIVIDGSLENTFGPLHLADRKALSLIGPIYFSDPARYVKKPVLFDFGLKSVQILKDFEGE